MEEMRLWLLALLMVGNLKAQPVSVSGMVVRPDGTPASFARLVLVAEPPFGKGEAIWQEGRCDEGGRFQWRLPYPSELPAVVIAHQSGVGIGWKRVRLTTSTECVVPLLPSVSLTGRLRGGDEATLFVRQLRPIGLFNPHRLPLRLDQFVPDFLQTRTETDGRFAFADLPDGFMAVVETSSLPCRFEVPTTDGTDIALPPTGILSGFVLRPDGKPLAHADLHGSPEMAEAHFSGTLSPIPFVTRTDADGRFRIAVPAGRWTVWLAGRGDAEWVSVPQSVAVKAGEIVKVTIKAQRPGIVRGWVADAFTRFPLTRLFVRAQLVDRPWVVSEVAQRLPEGAYELRLPDGVWRLQVADERWQSEPVTIEVAEGAVVEAPFLFARPFPTVRVAVTDENGKPVRAWLADSLGDTGETDERGEATWTIPPDRPVRLIAATPDLTLWASATVTANQSEVRLRLRSGKAVKGRVMTKDKKPVANALVGLWVRWQEGETPICLQTQRTSPDGTFQFLAPVEGVSQGRLMGGNGIVVTESQ
ncbi:MAG: hypothetical protein PVTTEEND_002021 [Candidatus Fervidibacter sp.]